MQWDTPVIPAHWEAKMRGLLEPRSLRLAYKTWQNSISTKSIKKYRKKASRGGSCPWYQHFGRPRWADHEVRSSRPAWSTWWNPVSTKNAKISLAWWYMPVVPATPDGEAWTQEVEVAMSQYHATALQPTGRARARLRLKKTMYSDIQSFWP